MSIPPKYYFEVSKKDYHRLIECIYTYTRQSYKRADTEQAKNPDYRPKLKPLDIVIYNGLSKWNLDLSRPNVFKNHQWEQVQAPKRQRTVDPTVKRKYKKRKIDALPEDGAIYVEETLTTQIDLTEHPSSSTPPYDIQYEEMQQESAWETQTPCPTEGLDFWDIIH